MADIFCPTCGKQNPSNAETCWNCHMPLAPEGEASTPAGDSGTANNDWLSSLRGSSAEDSPQAGPPESGEENAEAQPGESSDWLDRIRQRSQADKQAEDEDWLKQFGEESYPAGETPDWLKDLGMGGREAQPADVSGTDQSISGQEPQPGTGSSDDWPRNLRGIEKEQEASPQVPGGTKALGGEESQDWMASLSAWQAPISEEPEEGIPADKTADQPMPPQVPPAQEPTPEQAAPAANLPDWLSQMPGAPEDSAPFSADLPDWLSTLPGSEEPAETPLSEPVSPAGSMEAQLSQPEEAAPMNIEPSGSGDAESSAAVPAAGEEQPGEPVPDWLKAFSAELPAREDQPLQQEEAAAPFIPEELPEWLNQPVSESSPAEEIPTEIPPGDETLEAAQIPGWVQAMRPVESVVPEPAAMIPPQQEGTPEKAGPLAGLVGTLSGEDLVIQVRKPPAYSSKLLVTEKQRQNAAWIEEMLSEEAQPQAARPERSHIPERVVRLVIALALIAALFLPMLAGTRFLPMPDLFPQEMVNLHSALQALPEGAPVLLAVDYEPGLSGEMRLASEPVINHLAARKVRLAVMSTVPTGPVLAESLLQAGNLPATNLGFLPGGTAGLQEFARRPDLALTYTLSGKAAWSDPALKGVSGMAGFSAVVVLTDNAETARSWIEQVQPALGQVPLLFVVSAQAAPMIQPYLDSGQAQGMVAGMAGGAMYAQINQQTGAAQSHWDSYQLGLFLAVILILIGGIIRLFADLVRRPARRRASQDAR